METLDHLLARLPDQTVLCVGDLMLDSFIYGEVVRISPEAATPVLSVSREENSIGGAGHVARSVSALGARCIFVGLIGDDDNGKALAAAFADDANIQPHLVVDPSRPTTRKARFVSEHHSTHLLRADWELAAPASSETEAKMLAHILPAITCVDTVILSDYGKGALTPRVLAEIIAAARSHAKPVIVDPKGRDYTIYRGATIITPNRKEFADATHVEARSTAQFAQAAAALADAIAVDAVLVTRSEDGMTLYQRGGEAIHVSAYPVRVRDVSGAGDTVAALLGITLGQNAGFETAMRLANAAASVVVGKRGTATLSAAELRARILPPAVLAAETKIVADRHALGAAVEAWRRDDLRIGFTNGCFDLLHPGHVHLLAAARGTCDRLVVGLNSDVSVRGLKGAGRPIQDEIARAQVLAALEAVDLVVIFGEATPVELIRDLRPKVLVKGADYSLDQVVGREIVEADGGEVVLVSLVPGHSTTRLVAQSAAPASTGSA